MLRSFLLLGTIAALHAVMFVSTADAQTYSGTYTQYLNCVPTQNGSIPNQPAVEERILNSTCPTFGCQPPSTASVAQARWNRLANRGLLSSASSIFGHQFTAEPCGAGAGGICSLQQIVTAHDVIFSHQVYPGTTGPISLSMNVEFSGTVDLGPIATASSEVGIWAGPNEWYWNAVSLISGRYFGTGSGNGVLAGYSNDWSLVTLTSNSFSADLLVPRTIHLSLKTAVDSMLVEQPNPSTTNPTSDAILSLPRTGPVFNLPQWITCNSVELGIVNNQWVSPVSASATSVGSGCPGSNAQPLVLSAIGLPSLGNASFALSLTGPADGSTAYAYLALGLASTPLQTGGSCFVFLDVTSALSLMSAGLSPIGPVTVTGGAATFPIPIPMTASLFGFSGAVQGIVFDAGVPGGIAASNALVLLLAGS